MRDSRLWLTQPIARTIFIRTAARDDVDNVGGRLPMLGVNRQADAPAEARGVPLRPHLSASGLFREVKELHRVARVCEHLGRTCR